MFVQSQTYNGTVAKRVDAPVAITHTLDQAKKMSAELNALAQADVLTDTMALDDLRLVLAEVLQGA